MENNKQTMNATSTTFVQTAYEANVNKRVVDRVGRLGPDKSKGIVHEVLYTDKMNVTKPELGNTRLTKSSTAMRDDVVSVKDGVVTHRAQLKDTVSGINKTINQAKSGKYQGTKLLGTEETTALYNKKVGSAGQEMTSTGISSKDTRRIADTFSGNKTSFENVAFNSVRAGKTGAVVNVAFGLVEDIMNDETEDEIVAHVASNGIRGFAAGCAGSAAGTAATTAAVAGLANVPTIAASAPLLVAAAPVVAGIAAAAVVGTVVMEVTDGEVKEAIEDVTHEVMDFASEVGESAISFIDDVISEGLNTVSNVVDDFFSGVSSFFDWF